jgi:hypothetical protein
MFGVELGQADAADVAALKIGERRQRSGIKDRHPLALDACQFFLAQLPQRQIDVLDAEPERSSWVSGRR